VTSTKLKLRKWLKWVTAKEVTKTNTAYMQSPKCWSARPQFSQVRTCGSGQTWSILNASRVSLPEHFIELEWCNFLLLKWVRTTGGLFGTSVKAFECLLFFVYDLNPIFHLLWIKPVWACTESNRIPLLLWD
jgi:hypothetical protein